MVLSMNTQGNDMSIKVQKTERTFSNSRGSSSIMAEDVTPAQVAQFMQTSFYLPVDILKHPEWVVDKIQVISGEHFNQYLRNIPNLHCLESEELLAGSNHVAISHRFNVKTGDSFIVAKIWYGEVK